jgi:hypothetical protein
MFSSLFSNNQVKLNFLRLISHNIQTNLSRNKNEFGRFIEWNNVDELDSGVGEKDNQKDNQKENHRIKILQDGYYQFMFQGVVQKEKIYYEKNYYTTITDYCNSLIIISKNDEPFSVYYDNNFNQESGKFINISLLGIVELKENDIVTITLGHAILPKGIPTEFNLIKI